MHPYHLRNKDKAITAIEALRAIIVGQKYLTLALCKDNVPYLATLSYGYAAANCFYFHCTKQGKKVDYLRANPHVWGQIIQDDGYLADKCNHAYHSVQFEGPVAFLDTFEEKHHALEIMVDQLEPDPDAVKARMLTEKRIAGINIGCIDIIGMMGKRNG